MENYLYVKFRSLIDEIFIAVGENKISSTSHIVKSATQALKILNGVTSNNEPQIIGNDKFRGISKLMFGHVTEVVDLILNKGMSFNLACKEIAKNKSITVSSVQQACCRSQKLSANDWKKMSQDDKDAKKLIYNSLVNKYFEHRDFLKKLFQNT